MINHRGILVLGTDTGIGKTLVSAAWLCRLKAQGLKVAGMKPVSSGVDVLRGGAGCAKLANPDVDLLRACTSIELPQSCIWINPYGFFEPVAPNFAARKVGTQPDMEVVLQAYQSLSKLADQVVVEGAGGVLSPFSDQYSMLDLAVRIKIPVLLVVGMRLGCLNHALLSHHQLSQQSVPVLGWVANDVVPDELCAQENFEYLCQHLPIPCLGHIPYLRVAQKRLTPQIANFAAEFLK